MNAPSQQYLKHLNHLAGLATLNNRYFVMRHGESLANQQGLIVSSPDNGLDAYGLSDNGREQVQQSVQRQMKQGFLPTRIVSSDFRRAKDTALIAHELFGCASPLVYESKLRERFFGELELGDHARYQQVWDEDKIDGNHNVYQAESAAAVLARVTAVVGDLESSVSGQICLLVSHGDSLQILQTAFQKIAVEEHRSLAHLETAEIRELVLDTEPS